MIPISYRVNDFENIKNGVNINILSQSNLPMWIPISFGDGAHLLVAYFTASFVAIPTQL